MNDSKPRKLLRDTLIGRVYQRMLERDDIFFLSDDMGAPVLDKMRVDCADRFINVGIAEQNMINVATGLALEGYTVFTYGIAPFFMRAYEPLRVNLAITGQTRRLNVNMIAVGVGVSYDASGPTHHCLEDLTVMRALPGLDLFSIPDPEAAASAADHCLENQRPCYLRLDGKPMEWIYAEGHEFNWQRGFELLRDGGDALIISTGFMTHKAIELSRSMAADGKNIGVVDLLSLTQIDRGALTETVAHIPNVITLEEGFINRGGLDSLIREVKEEMNGRFQLACFGFKEEYLFKYASREFLYRQHGFSQADLESFLRGQLA